MMTDKQKAQAVKNKARNIRQRERDEEKGRIEADELLGRLHGMSGKPRRKNHIEPFQVTGNERLQSVAEWVNENRQSALTWHENGKAKTRETSAKYRRERVARDPAFKLLNSMRTRLSSAIKAQGARKTNTTMMLCGCSLESLKSHIESQFTEGMTWENQGDWHIDHIKPCSKFDLLDAAQQAECFHFTNLQPMWAMDNWKKSNR